MVLMFKLLVGWACSDCCAEILARVTNFESVYPVMLCWKGGMSLYLMLSFDW